MITNPYNPLGIQWQDNHLINARVGQEDFFFLKQKFPYYPGLIDKLVSNLFKKTIDELRRRDQEQRIETALYIDDPSYRILDDIIGSLSFGVERRSVGEYSVGGPTPTQHVTRTVDSIRSEMQCVEVVSSNEEGRPKTRKRSAKNTKKKEK